MAEIDYTKGSIYRNGVTYAIENGCGKSPEVLDVLDSESRIDALSANQGYVLDNKKAEKSDFDRPLLIPGDGSYAWDEAKRGWTPMWKGNPNNGDHPPELSPAKISTHDCLIYVSYGSRYRYYITVDNKAIFELYTSYTGEITPAYIYQWLGTKFYSAPTNACPVIASYVSPWISAVYRDGDADVGDYTVCLCGGTSDIRVRMTNSNVKVSERMDMGGDVLRFYWTPGPSYIHDDYYR